MRYLVGLADEAEEIAERQAKNIIAKRKWNIAKLLS
jgi:hypothetical protein